MQPVYSESYETYQDATNRINSIRSMSKYDQLEVKLETIPLSNRHTEYRVEFYTKFLEVNQNDL